MSQELPLPADQGKDEEFNDVATARPPPMRLQSCHSHVSAGPQPGHSGGTAATPGHTRSHHPPSPPGLWNVVTMARRVPDSPGAAGSHQEMSAATQTDRGRVPGPRFTRPDRTSRTSSQRDGEGTSGLRLTDRQTSFRPQGQTEYPDQMTRRQTRVPGPYQRDRAGVTSPTLNPDLWACSTARDGKSGLESRHEINETAWFAERIPSGVSGPVLLRRAGGGVNIRRDERSPLPPPPDRPVPSSQHRGNQRTVLGWLPRRAQSAPVMRVEA